MLPSPITTRAFPASPPHAEDLQTLGEAQLYAAADPALAAQTLSRALLGARAGVGPPGAETRALVCLAEAHHALGDRARTDALLQQAVRRGPPPAGVCQWTVAALRGRLVADSAELERRFSAAALAAAACVDTAADCCDPADEQMALVAVQAAIHAALRVETRGCPRLRSRSDSKPDLSEARARLHATLVRVRARGGERVPPADVAKLLEAHVTVVDGEPRVVPLAAERRRLGGAALLQLALARQLPAASETAVIDLAAQLLYSVPLPPPLAARLCELDRRGARLAGRAGDALGFEALARRALSVAQSPQQQALCHRDLASALGRLWGRQAEALAHAQRAVSLAREAGTGRVLGSALHRLGCQLAAQDPQAAKAALDEAMWLRTGRRAEWTAEKLGWLRVCVGRHY